MNNNLEIAIRILEEAFDFDYPRSVVISEKGIDDVFIDKDMPYDFSVRLIATALIKGKRLSAITAFSSVPSEVLKKFSEEKRLDLTWYWLWDITGEGEFIPRVSNEGNA